MSSIYGNQVKISLFGESHGRGIGCVIDGLRPGLLLDEAFIRHRLGQRREGVLRIESFAHFAGMLDRSEGAGNFRAARSEDGAFSAERSQRGSASQAALDPLTTSRSEKDEYELWSGVRPDGRCQGSPLTAIFENGDVRSQDYAPNRMHFRPGHADYVSYVRSHGYADLSGGGHFSGRLTAPLVFAGAICEQLLAERGIGISAVITAIGGVPIVERPPETLSDLDDSFGSVVEAEVSGMPVGVGAPFFDTLEGEISKLVFSVPGVKGIAFGSGFHYANSRGSETLDTFYADREAPAEGILPYAIKTETNHNGGINGGVSNGMPITFSVAIKPTPSIGKPIRTLHFGTMEQQELRIGGRHDKCIGLRAIAGVVAATAIALINQDFDCAAHSKPAGIRCGAGGAD